jgi:hypothetical protein
VEPGSSSNEVTTSPSTLDTVYRSTLSASNVCVSRLRYEYRTCALSAAVTETTRSRLSYAVVVYRGVSPWNTGSDCWRTRPSRSYVVYTDAVRLPIFSSTRTSRPSWSTTTADRTPPACVVVTVCCPPLRL